MTRKKYFYFLNRRSNYELFFFRSTTFFFLSGFTPAVRFIPEKSGDAAPIGAKENIMQLQHYCKLNSFSLKNGTPSVAFMEIISSGFFRSYIAAGRGST